MDGRGTKENRTKENRTQESCTKENRTMENRTKESRTKENRTMENRTQEKGTPKEVMSALAVRGYRCGEVLGEGAFSRVYRAKRQGGGMYACKVSREGKMLKREAEIMEKLRHPLFPAFLEFWENDGRGFLIMELISGDNLEAMLERRGRFSAEQVRRTGMELAEGLLYLHERKEKYLFRDVKPANIMIRQDGRIKLLDLGCVCSMREKTSARAGTPGFASPGQLEGKEEPAESADIYGLGRTLESMLGEGERGLRLQDTGHVLRPPGKENRMENRIKRRQKFRKTDTAGGQRRRREKAKRKLERILEACTRPEASERISNMRDVRDLLAEPAATGESAWRQEARCRKNVWESMYKRS